MWWNSNSVCPLEEWPSGVEDAQSTLEEMGIHKVLFVTRRL